MQADALIVSLDETYAQYIVHILSPYLHRVEISPVFPTVQYDYTIIDLDTVALPKEKIEGVVLLTSFTQKKPDNTTYLWADRPFRPARLLALLDLSETKKQDSLPEILPVEDRMSVYIGEHEIPLTEREFSLFMILFQANGKPVDGNTLIERVWKEGGGTENHLRVYIHYLREKLEFDGVRRIFSHRANGYSLWKEERL